MWGVLGFFCNAACSPDGFSGQGTVEMRGSGEVWVGCDLRWMDELLFTDFVLMMKMFVWQIRVYCKAQ